MKISKQERETGVGLAVSGNLTIANSVALKAALVEALNAGQPTTVSVTGASGVDLSCLQLLLAASRTFRIRSIPFEIEDSKEQCLATAAMSAGLAGLDGLSQ